MKQSGIQAFTQSGYYKLTRQLMPQTLKTCLLLFAAMCIFGSAKLYGGIEGFNPLPYPYLLPYDALVQTTGIHIVFFIVLAVFLVVSVLHIHRDLYRSKGFYTIMTLPIPRRHVFFAYCTAGIVGVLLLWAAQVVLLLLWYPILTAACQNIIAFRSSEFYQNAALSLYRANGLFLAAVKGPLFRLLLPMTVIDWLSSLLFALMLGCLPAYLLIGERKRAAWVFSFPLAPAFAITVRYRWSCATGEYNNGGLYSLGIADGHTAFIVSAALAVALLAFMLWRGVYNCNRDGNL